MIIRKPKSTINWNAIAMFKYTAITDGINKLTRSERMELQEADEVMAIAKLSDRNLLKPGLLVSILSQKLKIQKSRRD